MQPTSIAAWSSYNVAVPRNHSRLVRLARWQGTGTSPARDHGRTAPGTTAFAVGRSSHFCLFPLARKQEAQAAGDLAALTSSRTSVVQ